MRRVTVKPRYQNESIRLRNSDTEIGLPSSGLCRAAKLTGFVMTFSSLSASVLAPVACPSPRSVSFIPMCQAGRIVPPCQFPVVLLTGE
jgi:hypothetical protein